MMDEQFDRIKKSRFLKKKNEKKKRVWFCEIVDSPQHAFVNFPDPPPTTSPT